MFKKTLEALKAAEKAAKAELDALWVEFDPKTGTGGTHWNASGSSVLQTVQLALAHLRTDVERRQAQVDAAQAEADAAAKAAKTAKA